MAAKPLDSAMANLTLQTLLVGQRSSVAGPPAANSSLEMHFVGSTLDGQVRILVLLIISRILSSFLHGSWPTNIFWCLSINRYKFDGGPFC